MMYKLSVGFNLGETGSQLSPQLWMMSSLVVVFNLGDTGSPLSPREWMMSLVGLFLT